jgi:hypothetical protein
MRPPQAGQAVMMLPKKEKAPIEEQRVAASPVEPKKDGNAKKKTGKNSN